MSGNDELELQIASQRGIVERVRFLLENGADCTVEDNFAIQLACESGHVEVVRLLLENGADCTADNNAAIQSASSNGHVEVVRLLLENGADDDNFAIQSACESGHVRTMRVLFEYGAFEKIENSCDVLQNEHNEWKRSRDELFMSIDECLLIKGVSKNISHLIFSCC